MKESFLEYKKTLDLNLIGIKYLYDGDINFSTDCSYSEIKPNELISPTFMINCISKIYNESFENMKLKSTELSISEESIKFEGNWSGLDENKLLSIIESEFGCQPNYIFLSKNSERIFGQKKIYATSNNRPLPSHFYKLFNIGKNMFTEVLVNPLIEDSEDELIVYAVDKSFQSLVYSIQNMEYTTRMVDKSECVHIIDYKLYDCKFKSLKIIIRNISKIREDKINEILN